MSCSLTVDAVRDRTKTVTRRHIDTWRTLQPGDRLTLVEKAMGLPKGARQVVLADAKVVRVHDEHLGEVTRSECRREGFPNLTPDEFCAMWMRSHGYPQGTNPCDVPVRRIEWRYLDDGGAR